MLDGNAMFGNTYDRLVDGVVTTFEWYEMYLPNAHALYEGNGGNDGWAGETSFCKVKK